MGAQNRRFESIRAMNEIEKARAQLQIMLDQDKSIEERRQLGQFSTPLPLAKELVNYALKLLGNDENISFLEPAFGTGAFFSALLSEVDCSRIESAVGFEVDSHYGKVAQELWKGMVDLRIADFTKANVDNQSFNLLITNPPYVRHHYISQHDKKLLKKEMQNSFGVNISGLAGLYCYFILLAHAWLKPGAISGWLVPSEFMDVNYGGEIKKYLLEKVHLLRIHRYDPQKAMFDDALVSSAVIWFKNETIVEDYQIEFSFGGTHDKPEVTKKISKSVLLKEKKWTRFPCKDQRDVSTTDLPKLKDFFSIKRGLATGDNGFFIFSKDKIEANQLDIEFFKPILPSPRFLNTDIIEADKQGNPNMEKQYFLLNCTLPPHQIQTDHPELWAYLKSGEDTVSKGYLCKSRKQWYFQELRNPAPILCTYMGRNSHGSGRPFHFILNYSQAIASNSYLMLYPKDLVMKVIEDSPCLLKKIWEHLNMLTADNLESEGRVYGGGLKKIEPKELGEVHCSQLAELIFGYDYDLPIND